MELTKTAIIRSGLAILALLGASLVLAYATPLRDPATVLFKRVYPAVIIDGRFLSINNVYQAEQVAESLGLQAQDGYDQLVASEKKAALAKRLNLKIPDDALADEIRYLSIGNEEEYRLLLTKHYQGSSSVLEKYLALPRVYDAYLRMKYHADISAQSAEYRQAQETLKTIKSGRAFEDAAKTASDDRITGQLGGDLGLYEPGQIIPELHDQISISAVGEVRSGIVTSRLGYHIIYPVEQVVADGKKHWHAKHILFAPSGYEEWVKGQTKNIPVYRIKK